MRTLAGEHYTADALRLSALRLAGCVGPARDGQESEEAARAHVRLGARREQTGLLKTLLDMLKV